jgi:hypothetical protein
MAHALILGNDRRSQLRHLAIDRLYPLETIEPVGNKLSWKVVGVATTLLISGGGWTLILLAIRRLIH